MIEVTVEVIALIAAIVSIILAGFAIWQANHHRDQSDKLNRDTTEKLARIEAFATSTKEDAFAEIKRWGDFARAGGRLSEEAEKGKEEELIKLKDEIQATTSAEITKVLRTVESKLTAPTQASTINEIKKEFEELKKEMGKIQEKGLSEFKRIEIQKRFNPLWFSLSIEQRNLLAKAAKDSVISKAEFEKAGVPVKLGMQLMAQGVVEVISTSESGTKYIVLLTPEFDQFLKSLE